MSVGFLIFMSEGLISAVLVGPQPGEAWIGVGGGCVLHMQLPGLRLQRTMQHPATLRTVQLPPAAMVA